MLYSNANNNVETKFFWDEIFEMALILSDDHNVDTRLLTLLFQTYSTHTPGYRHKLFLK